jgi:hypothetical protein
MTASSVMAGLLKTGVEITCSGEPSHPSGERRAGRIPPGLRARGLLRRAWIYEESFLARNLPPAGSDLRGIVPCKEFAAGAPRTLVQEGALAAALLLSVAAICAASPEEHIVSARPTEKIVRLRVPVETIVSAGAEEEVAALPAVYEVAPIAPIHRAVTTPAGTDAIRAATGVDRIGAVSANDDIGSAATGNEVVTGSTHDCGRRPEALGAGPVGSRRRRGESRRRGLQRERKQSGGYAQCSASPEQRSPRSPGWPERSPHPIVEACPRANHTTVWTAAAG